RARTRLRRAPGPPERAPRAPSRPHTSHRVRPRRGLRGVSAGRPGRAHGAALHDRRRTCRRRAAERAGALAVRRRREAHRRAAGGAQALAGARGGRRRDGPDAHRAAPQPGRPRAPGRRAARPARAGTRVGGRRPRPDGRSEAAATPGRRAAHAVRHGGAGQEPGARRARPRRGLHREGGAPFFAFESHFGDILARGGFDVIVGNPPWVRGERLPAQVREALTTRYSTWRPASRQGFAHLPDLAVAFVERALELAAPGGVAALLVPAKLASSGYVEPLRQLLAHGPRIERAAAVEGAAGAFEAAVYPMALVAVRGEPGPSDQVA